jgi:ribosome maturation factor RimP
VAGIFFRGGRFAHFLFVVMDLNSLLETTVLGLGYELVDIEMSPRGRTIRVFIDLPDKDGGVDVDDCARVSNQLSRVFEVENVDYDRLEISSPGLDRVVRKAVDFERFAGQDIQIKLRIPVNNRRNFQGELLGHKDGKVGLRLEKEEVELEFNNIEKARLVPRFD